MNRGRYAAAGVVAVVTIAGCGVVSYSTETHTYRVSDPINRLVVEACAGAVTIASGTGPVQVTEALRYSRTRPSPTHTTEAGTLRLHSGDCDAHGLRMQSVGYTVRVPAATAVEITADAGAVDLTGIGGDVSVTASAGQVSGDALGSRHTTIKADAGRVTLRYATAPSNVDVQASAGAIDIAVPADGPYQVDAHTEAGRSTVSVPQDSTASHRITAHSDAGSVRVLPV
jgi:hypothetical protein